MGHPDMYVHEPSEQLSVFMGEICKPYEIWVGGLSYFLPLSLFRVNVTYGSPRINYLTQDWHVIPSMATTAKSTALVSNPISEILAASAVGVRSPPDAT